MLIKIFLVLAALIAAFIIVVALRPADFRISRSATISAEKAVVFAQVNDLHKFNDWSPWAKIDPNSTATFDGAPAGVGASFAWAGNREVGEGRMTIIDSTPSDLVRMKLEFFKPFAATNTAEFTFVPAGDQTTVTWSMMGTNSFMAKAVGLFIDCDKMVGGQFEQGLENLRNLVTSKSTAP